jgi:hypothetical protein
MSEEALKELIIENELSKIQAFGQKYGFINNFYRKQIYPKLLELEEVTHPNDWLSKYKVFKI